jgi:hypothetical protein
MLAGLRRSLASSRSGSARSCLPVPSYSFASHRSAGSAFCSLRLIPRASSFHPHRRSAHTAQPAGARCATPRHSARLAFQTITRDVDLHLMDLDARLVNDTIAAQPFGARLASRVRPDSHQTVVGLRSRRSAQVPGRFGSPGAMGADFSKGIWCGSIPTSCGATTFDETAPRDYMVVTLLYSGAVSAFHKPANKKFWTS